MLDLLDCLILQDIEQVGSEIILELNSRFESIDDIWESSRSELEDIIGRGEVVNNILKSKSIDKKKYALSINLARGKGIQIYCIFDEEYPGVLKELKDPPPVLYLKGELPEDINKNIAIIGTRNTTHHGNRLTRDCSKTLAKNGYIVISGLSRGADTAAHLGALDGGGRTIAVLGSGIDEIYPSENDELSKDIVNNGGALISESPLGARCQDLRLKERNRLISCLSKAVIAAEAKEKTGTSIAVQHAVQLGRKIFVIPALRESSINYTNYQKDLVYLGAINVLDPADVLNNLLNDRGYIETSDFLHFISNDFKINYNEIAEKETKLNSIPETDDNNERFILKDSISSTKKEDKRKGKKKHIEGDKITKLSMYSEAE